MSIDKAIQSLVDKYSLNVMQAKFVLGYTGNATEAARKAGYKQPHVQGSRLLKDDRIRRAISRPQPEIDTPTVKLYDREALIKYWSTVLEDSSYSESARMKASENLARAQAVFIDKQAIMGQFTHEHLDRLSDNELIDKVLKLLDYVSDTEINSLIQAKLLPAPGDHSDD